MTYSQFVRTKFSKKRNNKRDSPVYLKLEVMSFIEQWQCEEFDEWWQFDQDCCRWNRGHWRCENWWEDHPELLEDIGPGS